MTKLVDINIQQLLTQSLLLTKDGVALFDKEDRLVFCNDALADLFGVNVNQALNQTFASLCLRCFNTPNGINIEFASFDDWMTNANAKRRSSQFRSFETDTQDGRWFLITEQVVQEDFIFMHSTDITSKKESEFALKLMSDKLKEIVDKDYLTGLYNRRYFYKKANGEFNRSKRTEQHLSLLIFDLDNFKMINDNFGHAAGDAVLQAFSNAIKPLLREYDTFARIGGEEFALLLPATESHEAYTISERIRKLIDQLVIPFDNHTLKVTTSIGLSDSYQGISEFEQLMRLADKNLYRAKVNGRNQTIKI